MVDLYHTFWIRPWPCCLPQNILFTREKEADRTMQTRWVDDGIYNSRQRDREKNTVCTQFKHTMFWPFHTTHTVKRVHSRSAKVTQQRTSALQIFPNFMISNVIVEGKMTLSRVQVEAVRTHNIISCVWEERTAPLSPRWAWLYDQISDKWCDWNMHRCVPQCVCLMWNSASSEALREGITWLRDLECRK